MCHHFFQNGRPFWSNLNIWFALQPARVTRFGDFSTIRRLFSLGISMKMIKGGHILTYFFHGEMLSIILKIQDTLWANFPQTNLVTLISRPCSRVRWLLEKLCRVQHSFRSMQSNVSWPMSLIWKKLYIYIHTCGQSYQIKSRTWLISCVSLWARLF
jgi:hypothetical protein